MLALQGNSNKQNLQTKLLMKCTTVISGYYMVTDGGTVRQGLQASSHTLRAIPIVLMTNSAVSVQEFHWRLKPR